MFTGGCIDVIMISPQDRLALPENNEKISVRGRCQSLIIQWRGCRLQTGQPIPYQLFKKKLQTMSSSKEYEGEESDTGRVSRSPRRSVRQKTDTEETVGRSSVDVVADAKVRAEAGNPKDFMCCMCREDVSGAALAFSVKLGRCGHRLCGPCTWDFVMMMSSNKAICPMCRDETSIIPRMVHVEAHTKRILNGVETIVREYLLTEAHKFHLIGMGGTCGQVFKRLLDHDSNSWDTHSLYAFYNIAREEMNSWEDRKTHATSLIEKYESVISNVVSDAKNIMTCAMRFTSNEFYYPWVDAHKTAQIHDHIDLVVLIGKGMKGAFPISKLKGLMQPFEAPEEHVRLENRLYYNVMGHRAAVALATPGKLERFSWKPLLEELRDSYVAVENMKALEENRSIMLQEVADFEAGT